MRKAIGGFFELELGRKRNDLLAGKLLFNTCSNALRFLLKELGVRTVWIPDYTCPSVVYALKRDNLRFRFYSINRSLELESLPFEKSDTIILNNYFGLKSAYIDRVVKVLPDLNVIIDCAQAFYYKTDSNSYCIYSARKFFGVPDGGLLSGLKGSVATFPAGSVLGNFFHLLGRLEAGPEDFYDEFLKCEGSLLKADIAGMSVVTQRILNSVDFDDVAGVRRRNFMRLHESLGPINFLEGFDILESDAPLCYPFWTHDKQVRTRLQRNRVYVPSYWGGIEGWAPRSAIAVQIADEILPLPIDQRYRSDEMDFIAQIVLGR